MPVFGFRMPIPARWRMRGSNPRPSPCKGEKGESPAVPRSSPASLPDAGNAPATPPAAGAPATPQGTPVAALSAALSGPADETHVWSAEDLERHAATVRRIAEARRARGVQPGESLLEAIDGRPLELDEGPRRRDLLVVTVEDGQDPTRRLLEELDRYRRVRAGLEKGGAW